MQSPNLLPPASKYYKELKRWMDQKGFSSGYKDDILRHLKPIEKKKIHQMSELREIVSSSSSSMVLTVISAYISFLHDSEIINEGDSSILQERTAFKKNQSRWLYPHRQ